MKSIHLLFLPAICFSFLQSCNKAVASKDEKTNTPKTTSTNAGDTKDIKQTYDLNHVVYSDTKGIGANGDIFTSFDCPDAKDFQPIDIKNWDKTPVVNGRLPTYEETHNGLSIHHYGGDANGVKVYPMTLPRLASVYSTRKKQYETVVVIQIVQTAKDTVVGYRYLTGGCGGSLFKNFHFLTVAEIQSITK